MVARAQAQAKAALVDDTKRCVGDTVHTDTTSYAPLPCTVDGVRPCMVVDQWGPVAWGGMARDAGDVTVMPARWGRILDMVRPHLDCARCSRAAERDAATLGGLRLGKLERRVLLLAPPPSPDRGALLEPVGTGRAAIEAHLRAIRKLRRAGLILVDWQQQTVEAPRRGSWRHMWASTQRVAVQLSPLGAAVVGQVRPKLTNGTPIRWAQHRAWVLAAVGDTTSAVQAALIAELRADAASSARIAAVKGALTDKLKRVPGDNQQAHYDTALNNSPAYILARAIDTLTRFITQDDADCPRAGE